MPRNAATNRLAIRDYPASLSFNGSTTAVALGNVLNAGTGDLTLNVWFRTTNSQTLQGMITKKTDLASTGAIGYSMFLENGRIRVAVSDGALLGRRDSSTSLVVPNNTWCMATMRWVASTGILTVFFNGSPNQATQFGTAPTGTLTTTEQLRFGSDNGARRFMSGNLSDAQVWLRALSDQEVSDLYYANIQATTSAGRWKMTEGAGSTLNDSVSSNNGTITAGTFVYDSPMKARKASVNANLVRNGDFEYAPPFTAATTTSSRYIDGSSGGSATNDLFGWFLTIGSGFTGSAQFDTSVKRSGAASLKLVSTVGNGASTVGLAASQTAASGPTVVQQNQYLFRVSPNTDYILTAYIKPDSIVSTDGNGARIRAVQYGGVSTSNTGTSEGNNITGTSDWSVSTVRFTTGSSSRFIQVLPVIYGDTTGTAWFDDISLTPVFPEGRVPANGNLVKNFDFEVIPAFTAAGTTSSRWIDGTAAGSSTNATYKWSQIIDATSCAISIDGTVSHSGSGSLKVDCLDATGRGRGCYGSRTGTGASLLVSELNLYAIRVPPSTGITMTYWIKTLNVQGGGAKIAVHEHDGAGVRVTSTSATAVAGTADWQQITFTVTTSATTQYLVLSAEIPTAGAAQTAWFDDIYLAKTTNPGRVVIT